MEEPIKIHPYDAHELIQAAGISLLELVKQSYWQASVPSLHKPNQFVLNGQLYEQTIDVYLQRLRLSGEPHGQPR